MYFKILLNIILGYVSIEIEGYFIERFMNLCNKEKMLIWGIKRLNSTKVRVNIGIKDFKKLKPIIKKTKCRVKINKKKVIPFLLHRYKKRKIFFALFLIIILLIILLSNFIWNIEITGNSRISKEEILSILQNNNFGIGKCKIGLKTKSLIDKIRLERGDIAWVGIDIKGTNAIVEVVEADLKPEIINENEFCNIIATKDGIITKIVAQNGTPVVSEGDMVTKGSILVGGWLEGKYTGTRYVHANGLIQARVWYSEKVKIPIKQIEKVMTGKQENKYSVKINNFKINLLKGVSKFEKYDTIETTKKLKLFSNFYLPIEIYKKTFNEYQEKEINYTLEEAKNIGIAKAQQQLENSIENKESIVDKKIYTNQTKEYVEVEVIYEVLENIGTKEKIVF